MRGSNLSDEPNGFENICLKKDYKKKKNPYYRKCYKIGDEDGNNILFMGKLKPYLEIK